MTDNEIIKALECCVSKNGKKCKMCPAFEECAEDLFAVEKAAIDLLNRQKAEIERLKVPKFLVENTLSEKGLSEILKKGRTGVIPHINYSIKRIDEDSIKSEAIKEFAERLKAEHIFWKLEDGTLRKIIPIYAIDYLVKEMAGDSE